MPPRTGFICLAALLVGCNLFASDGPDSIGGSWGGVSASLTVRHDSTFWGHDCFAGFVPLTIPVGPDGSFIAHGATTGATFGGSPLRLYGAVQGDTMHLYFQIENGDGTWRAPGASLLIRGQPATNPGILCIS